MAPVCNNDAELKFALEMLMQKVTYDVSVKVQAYLREFIDIGIYMKPQSRFYDRTHDFWESISIEPNDDSTGFEIFADPEKLPSKPPMSQGKLGSRMMGGSTTYRGVPISALIFEWIETGDSPTGRPASVAMYKQTIQEMDANFDKIVKEVFSKYGIQVIKNGESVGSNAEDEQEEFPW